MRNWKLLPALTVITLLIAVILYAAFYFVFLDFFVDLWWFEALEFEGYFWLRLLYRFIFSGAVTGFFFIIFFSHFWIASRYLGLNPPEEVLLDSVKRRRFQRFADTFMDGSIKFYIPLSLLLAVLIAIPFYNQWEAALLFFFGESAGITDPVYGNDVSFYLFSYPIYMLIQKELLTTACSIFVMVGGVYWLEHIFVPNQSKEYPLGAKIHLAILFGFIVLFVGWGFMLERFSLLYSTGREPVFSGPGFVDLRYNLPLIWLSLISFLAIGVAALLFVFSEKHRVKWPLLVSVLAFLTVQGNRQINWIPNMLEKLVVKPNPVMAEGHFMRHNIDATLASYDLKSIKEETFEVKLDATADIEAWSTQKHFENIPVWDREFLDDVYMQLQGIRPYYAFPSVDEDRYYLNGHHQQVNLAAREHNIQKLPKEAQNWENDHMRYTHGYGAVVSPAAQDAAEPIVWYLRDLNMHSDVGFKITHPDIYYGQDDHYHYAIVPNNLDIVGIAGSDPTENSVYEGNKGIPIPSYFRKLLFAFYFKDEKIFFSNSISTHSKMLIRQNIINRVKTLTPFLYLDKDPYLVLGEDRMYWMMDGYTLSNEYPVAKRTKEKFLNDERTFNYIRNSVKIVVDAYDGSVKYYIADTSDPMIMAYSRAYPGVFRSLSEMPESLLQHVRYPRDLYAIQMQIYAKYHQTDPKQFYEQSETWQLAMVHDVPLLPYFMTLDLGHCQQEEEFVMLSPMTPIHRDNLSMVGIAGSLDREKCQHNYKPHITVLKFPNEVQVNGPTQVDALIDQNPEIAAQFSLWGKYGAEVKRGRMIILPMGNSVLYVQPVYMLSNKTKIPELARVIASIGNQVVMDKTLWSAFEQLKAKFEKNALNSGGSGTSTKTSQPLPKPENP